uniref:Protein kinase domain-containing protein n=1 Tax=Ditylenchus dipsaci TaxID=166011 RepID=A0A915CM08_9BILA
MLFDSSTKIYRSFACIWVRALFVQLLPTIMLAIYIVIFIRLKFMSGYGFSCFNKVDNNQANVKPHSKGEINLLIQSVIFCGVLQAEAIFFNSLPRFNLTGTITPTNSPSTPANSPGTLSTLQLGFARNPVGSPGAHREFSGIPLGFFFCGIIITSKHTNYEIVKVLGEGGFGAVFDVKDTKEEKKCYAMKVEPRQARKHNKLKMEIDILKRVSNERKESHFAKIVDRGQSVGVGLSVGAGFSKSDCEQGVGAGVGLSVSAGFSNPIVNTSVGLGVGVSVGVGAGARFWDM